MIWDWFGPVSLGGAGGGKVVVRDAAARAYKPMRWGCMRRLEGVCFTGVRAVESFGGAVNDGGAGECKIVIGLVVRSRTTFPRF